MLRRYVGWYDVTPKGYRTARVDWCRCRCVAYPIGLHWVMMFLHRLWGLTYWYPRSRYERRLAKLSADAYDAGRQCGYAEGYQQGRLDGIAAYSTVPCKTAPERSGGAT